MAADERNYDITNKIFSVLNNVKGFEVALGNPKNGVIIARYEGTSFYINIEPIFNNNEEGKEADTKPFDEIVKNHKWVFR